MPGRRVWRRGPLHFAVLAVVMGFGSSAGVRGGESATPPSLPPAASSPGVDAPLQAEFMRVVSPNLPVPQVGASAYALLLARAFWAGPWSVRPRLPMVFQAASSISRRHWASSISRWRIPTFAQKTRRTRTAFVATATRACASSTSVGWRCRAVGVMGQWASCACKCTPPTPISQPGAWAAPSPKAACGFRPR